MDLHLSDVYEKLELKDDIIIHADEIKKRIDSIVEKEDIVNHPSHYETGKFECIEVMEEALGKETVMNFCLGNAFKYLYRCMSKHKEPGIDIKKARWYINKWLELNGDD